MGNYRLDLVKVLWHIGPATQLVELPARYNDTLTTDVKQSVSNDSEVRNFPDVLYSAQAVFGEWRR